MDIPEKEYGPIIGNEIKFIDGSLLNFEERISQGEEITSYLYEYIRPETGYFFGKDKCEVDESNIEKPIHHWHIGIKNDKGLIPLLKQSEYDKLYEKFPIELINHGGPHYNAPNMTLNDFLGVIILKFFKLEEKKLEKMLIDLCILKEEKELDKLTILNNRYKYLENNIEKLIKEKNSIMKEIQIELKKLKQLKKEKRKK